MSAIRSVILTVLLAACGGDSSATRSSAAAETKSAVKEQSPDLETSEVIELSITAAQSRMARGALTSVQLVRSYRDRIEQLDRRGPGLHSVIAIAPDAFDQAQRLDREREEGKVRGPLHGIPVLLKDNIESAELPTTAGSLALKDNRTARDAGLVRRLREAGAVILGKANLSEWANFRGHPSVMGWSAVGGLTRNPYDLKASAGGSSSGSAVAVSANFAVVAVGTETDGSIICPASFNGIVGLKPSRNLVDSDGIVPLASSLDTPGPLGRTVEDVAYTLGAMTGGTFEVDPARATFRGKRLGVLRLPVTASLEPLFEAALERMERAGAELVGVKVPVIQDGFERESQILFHEFRRDLNLYLSNLPDPGLAQLTLAKLIDFNEAHREREQAYFGQELFLAANQEPPLSDKAYAQAKTVLEDAAAALNSLFAQHRLDAFVLVASKEPFRVDLVKGDPDFGGMPPWTLAALAGIPNLTVPMGFVSEGPVGLSFVTAHGQDQRALELGYAFEQLTKHRRPPVLEGAGSK